MLDGAESTRSTCGATSAPGSRGRTDFDRDAGWAALVVVGGGLPAQEWYREIQALLVGLGWRTDGPFPDMVPPASPTLTTLEMLAGETRQGRLRGVDPAVAATAREVALH